MSKEDQPEKRLKRSDCISPWTYTEALTEHAIKKLEAKSTVECLELAVARVKEFESKMLPALRAQLGDSVDWLPEVKPFCTQIDEEVTIIPTPLIHFASICGHWSSNCRSVTEHFWNEQKWCYCPINDLIVLMTEVKTFLVDPEDYTGLRLARDDNRQLGDRVPLSVYLNRDKTQE